MNWKPIITVISLSTIMLSACGSENNAINSRTDNNARTYQNVTYHTPKTNGGDYRSGTTTYNGNNPNQNQSTINNQYVQNDNTANTQYNRGQTADVAARKISNLAEVERAKVIVTDHNAYVAVRLKNNSSKELTRNIEDTISTIVKATDQNINNVYVSKDPNYFDRMNSF